MHVLFLLYFIQIANSSKVQESQGTRTVHPIHHQQHVYCSSMSCRGQRVQRSGYAMYADSKLMLYMFGAELQKRLRSMGSSTDVFNAHPGVAQTDAFRKSDKSKIAARVLKSGADFIGQSAGGAAQSIMKCATDPSLTGVLQTASWDTGALDVATSLCVEQFICMAGMGGGDRHWGSWYTGIPVKPFGVTLPLCFTVNWNNYGFRGPINPLIHDPEACSKLYTATMDLVNEYASIKIEPCGRSNATVGRQ